MPNGGSDCCGTCWFNRANEGRAGHPKNPRGDAFCEIRGVPIANAFWTYCANHPHHNPNRVNVPVGPIFVCDDYPYTRRVLEKCPDTESVRSKLLELLEAMPETPRPEYPTATQFDEQVIDQLMAFREPRAVRGLLRVIRFDPDAAPPDDRFGRSRATTVGHAIEALAAIVGDEALDSIERCLGCGLAGTPSTTGYDPKQDRRAAVRYHAVRALEHCRADRAGALLETAKNDPHPEVRAFAEEISARREKPD